MLTFFRSSGPNRWHPAFDMLLHSTIAQEPESYIKFLTVSCEIMEAYRSPDGMSLTQIINILQQNQILTSDLELGVGQIAQKMVFNMIGWVSMLYTPSDANLLRESEHLRALAQSSAVTRELLISSYKAHRPLREMLRDLDTLLPVSVLEFGKVKSFRR